MKRERIVSYAQRRVVAWIILILLLVSVLVFGFDIRLAESSGTTYDRAGGSADVSTALTQLDKDGYAVDQATDWWPMFHHDLTHTGYSTSTMPNTNKTLWIHTTGESVLSSPVVADCKVYVGSCDDNVYCLNALTGKRIWKYTTGDDVNSPPAVADGKVYFGSRDHNVYCLNALTGGFIWKYTTGSWVDYSSPAVAYGYVYVGSCDGNVYCLDATGNGGGTTDLIWSYTTGNGVISSPAVAYGNVYVGSDDHNVYCLNALTGDFVWKYATGHWIGWSSPAVADGRVYVGSGDHNVYCLDATGNGGGTTDLIWSYTTDGEVYSSPAVADHKVYVGSWDHNVYCLNALTGEWIWNYTTGDRVDSSPAVAGGKVYVGSRDYKLYCFDASIGARIWSYTTGRDIAVSSPAVAGGKVYVGSADGKVYAFGSLVHALAFFGWYRATQMPPTGWDLLQRTFDWTTAGSNPAITTIVFFSYYGFPFQNDPYDEDAFAVYNKLLSWGYISTNILVCDIAGAGKRPSSFYYGYDLAVYWDSGVIGYDSTNIVTSGIPFISVQTMQTNEMGIGTGVRTLHEYRDDFCVVGIAYPTRPYPMGPLTFQSAMWFDATDSTDGGVSLVKASGKNVLIITTGPLKVSTNKMFYLHEKRETVAITVKNIGSQSIHFPVDPKVKILDASGGYVWPSILCIVGSSLPKNQGETILWDQRAGFLPLLPKQVPCGEYTVVTDSDMPEQYEAVAKFTIRNIGYCIIVAGSDQQHKETQIWIDKGCDTVYGDLCGLGYTADRIQYLNAYPDDPHPPICAPATRADFYSAIATWARGRVGPTEPLFIYMFDHGCVNAFAINNDIYGAEVIFASDLRDWLDPLQTATGASTYVIYNACESGSFIDELSHCGRVIITSTQDNEYGYFSSASAYWEHFAQGFWPRIVQGKSLMDAFNSAVTKTGTVIGAGYHPLLDDNGDGTGSRGPLPDGTGAIDDGSLAMYVYIGGTKWIFPWISYVIAEKSYSWPPLGPITLWAKVENETQLAHVQALMLPPDWVPPMNSTVLVETPFERFEMADQNHDGNWSVSIPAVNFTNHATGPSDFRFVITAEETDGNTAIPLWTGVEFTQTGLPSQDNVPPSVDIVRPIRGQIAQGIVTINGTATDDVCLQKVEIYVDDSLLGTVNLPPMSNSFFSVDFNTTTYPNGPATITVKAFDTSNNTSTQEVTITIANPLHNIAVTNVRLSKTVVGQGYPLSINVTIENQDVQTQTFQVTAYVSTTAIRTENVTLSAESSTTITFTWNTTGFAKGNYTISAYAWPVPDETDTSDNLFTDGWASVAMVGDINADGKVDLRDVYRVGQAFGSCPGHPRWNPVADINGDLKVDLKDIYIVDKHYGETDP